MKFLAFLLIALTGITMVILAQTGFFNVNPWYVIKQTTNLISKNDPVKIEIPSLRLTTSMERVGIDELGKMDAPSNASVVSWYKFSATPGEKGNMVISGHKDSSIGPGVFYTLRNIPDYAEIKLTKANGGTAVYKVTSVQQYDRAQLPANEIFASQNKLKLLYIITCDGNYDIFKKQYNKRIVVVAQAT